jgi:hypothetical protein
MFSVDTYSAEELDELSLEGHLGMAEDDGRVWSDINRFSVVEQRAALGVLALAPEIDPDKPLIQNVYVWMGTSKGLSTQTENPKGRRYVPSDQISHGTQALAETYGVIGQPVSVNTHPVTRGKDQRTLWAPRGFHLTARLFGERDKIIPFPQNGARADGELAAAEASTVMVYRLGLSHFLEGHKASFSASLGSLVHGLQEVVPAADQPPTTPRYRPMAVWGILALANPEVHDLDIRKEGPAYRDGRFVRLDRLHHLVRQDFENHRRILHLANTAVVAATLPRVLLSHLPDQWLDRLGKERPDEEPGLSGQEGWFAVAPKGLEKPVRLGNPASPEAVDRASVLFGQR